MVCVWAVPMLYNLEDMSDEVGGSSTSPTGSDVC